MVKEKHAERDALDELQAKIEKDYGSGSLVRGRGTIVAVETFPTGIATLDIALGCGGIPRGRILEIFGAESSGKTTLALQIAAECQRQIIGSRNGVVAFVDAEHALDPDWAAHIGVNLDELLISQPNSGEEALGIVERLVESELVDLVIIDSVAALIPKAELEGELGDAKIGARAQLMSKALSRLNRKCARAKSSILFLNQIRMKIGVVFGCLHADTKVNFVDGRDIMIREVVDNKLEGEVWSYDRNNRRFVPAKIVGWHNNGDVRNVADYLVIAAKGPGMKNGALSLTVTPDHLVLSSRGWLPARDLSIGSLLLTKQDALVFDNSNGINGTLGQFLTGVLSANSHLTVKCRFGAGLRISDNTNPAYAKWKADKLWPFIRLMPNTCRAGIVYRSSAFYTELQDIKAAYPNRDPMLLLRNFSWLGFAIWMMDDSTYSSGRYSLSMKRFAGDYDKITEISRVFDDLGLNHYVSISGYIDFDTDITDVISAGICKFVPPCMAHKLPAALQSAYIDFALARQIAHSDAYARVIGIREVGQRQMRQKGKYDLSVAGTECYLAGGSGNGVVVHNSPEDTPGGRALKFYSSVRLEVRKGSVIKDGEYTVGFRPTVKIVKNKVAAPFTTAEFDICVGRPERPTFGIDTEAALLDAAIQQRVVQRAGSSYRYDDKILGNGVARASQFLRDNATTKDEIRTKVYAAAFADKVTRPLVEVGEPDE